MRICGVVMLAASGWLAFAVLTGRIARRFLRFDPPGLTIGEAKYEFFIPWDAVTDVVEFELADNASVGITVMDPDAIEVTPAGMRAQVLHGLVNNFAMTGCHVAMMATHFNVPAESLAAAISNYARNPHARAELVAKPALPSRQSPDL
jgi:hypothetical protein